MLPKLRGFIPIWLAMVVALAVLALFVSISPTQLPFRPGVVKTAQFLNAETGSVRDVPAGKPLSTNFESDERCCKGTYRIERLPHEAVFFPALSCATRLRTGGVEYRVDDPSFTGVGPVIPLLPMSSAGPEFIEIDVDCPRSIFSGLWRSPPTFGDYLELTRLQRAELRFQVNLPLVTSLVFGLAAVCFWVIYVWTDKRFPFYRDAFFSLCLWTTFLLFLAGVPRQWNLTASAALHLPIRVAAAASVFLLLQSYVSVFSGRDKGAQGRRATLIAFAVIGCLILAANLIGQWKAATLLAAVALVLPYWPVAAWPVTRMNLRSSEFAVFVVVMITAIGGFLDAIKATEMAIGFSSPFAYFNRYTANLFMASAVVFFLQHVATIYRQLQREAVTVAKSKAVSRTVKMLAHDVRKPFTTIRFGLDAVERARTNPTKLQETIDLLRKESQRNLGRINALLRDVMDVGEDIKLSKQSEHLQTLAEDAFADVADICAKKKIELSTAVDPELEALLDRDKLLRVLVNLVDNAARVTPPGGRISIRADRLQRVGASGILLLVHNTGSFIPPDRRQKIFEDFFTEGNPDGTGLGLAIAKDFVSAHGGDIVCHSDADSGTTFEIRLPS